MVGHPTLLQRIGRASPLENEQRGKLPFALGQSVLAVDVAAIDVIHLERAVLDPGPVTIAGLRLGISWNLLELGQLALPEVVEVIRARRARLELPGSDGSAGYRLRGRVAPARGSNLEKQHGGFIEYDGHAAWFAGQIELAGVDQFEIILFER